MEQIHIINFDENKEYHCKHIYNLIKQFGFYVSNLIAQLQGLTITEDIREVYINNIKNKFNIKILNREKENEILSLILFQRLSQKKMEGKLIIHNYKVIGFVLYNFQSECIDLNYLFIHPQYRNMGFGNKLMNEIIELSTNMKLNISLETSNIHYFKKYKFNVVNLSSLEKHYCMLREHN